MPTHIAVGYSSHDAKVIRGQIRAAKKMGLSGFVVDWYGDRQPFIDESYALMQKMAGKEKFHVAMMYDQFGEQNGATDQVIADLTMFHDTYLSDKASGHKAYLTYDGRPLIFVFPNGVQTDWNRVRSVVNQWKPAPLLIEENAPGPYADDFDGFYPWIDPGPQGWAPDGSRWGQGYLDNFYSTMAGHYRNKMIVGGAWAQFDDSRASWGQNRHIAARCGQTLADTRTLWKKYFPNETIPFLLIETWNDYEEGSAIERGIPSCGNAPSSPVQLNSSVDPAGR